MIDKIELIKQIENKINKLEKLCDATYLQESTIAKFHIVLSNYYIALANLISNQKQNE